MGCLYTSKWYSTVQLSQAKMMIPCLVVAFICLFVAETEANNEALPLECKKDVKGKDYRGTISLTKTGKTCQAWTSDTPHIKSLLSGIPERFPEGNLEDAENNCRNPGHFTVAPWCYTTDPATRWEYCDIESCPDPFPSCPEGWARRIGACYKLIIERVSRWQSAAKCHSIKAELAVLTSMTFAEKKWMMRFTSSKGVSSYVWTSGNAFICKRFTLCEEPPIIARARPQEGGPWFIGTTVHYKCEAGYTSAPNDETWCQENGKWSDTLGECKRVNCGSPGILPNGNLHNTNYEYQSKMAFICDTGYILNGAEQSECLATGVWSERIPTCDKRIDCKQMGNPKHGQRIGQDFSLHGSVWFECNHGYRLVGEPQLKCQLVDYETAEWSHPQPTCQKIKACEAINETVGNGDLDCRYTPQDNSYICHIKCNEGYYFVSGPDYVTCGAETHFRWSFQQANHIRACTRGFFVDVELPLELTYDVAAQCSSLNEDEMQRAMRNKLVNILLAKNTLAKNQCDVTGPSVKCTDEDNNATPGNATSILEVNMTMVARNPIKQPMPLKCDIKCKRYNMRRMLKRTVRVKVKVETALTSDSEGTLAGYTVVFRRFQQTRPRILCAPGKVLTKNQVCVPCDVGYYLPDREMQHCLPCPKGTFQNEKGRVQCKPCLPKTTTMMKGATHAIMCNQTVKANHPYTINTSYDGNADHSDDHNGDME